MKPYLLAIDQGTSSCRTLIFDHKGTTINISQKELGISYPEEGWVEQDAVEIWELQKETIEQALSQSGISANDIASFGITNQRETTILWDKKTGVPIYNAIVWQDKRTHSKCLQLKEKGLESIIREKTGLCLDPYFSATKIAWILENIPKASELLRINQLAFGTVDTWVLWKLTNGKYHRTDPSNASRTLLYNIHTHTWDQELLEIFKIPEEILPTVQASDQRIEGPFTVKPIQNIPLGSILGDQQSSLFGQQCYRKGMAKNTYGTGCFLLMNTGEKPIICKNSLLTTIAWQIGDQYQYAIEGSVFSGGSTIQWLRDGLGIIKNAEESENLARKVKDTNGVIIVPAFTGLGAPHWDSSARAVILGISRGTTKNHIARASLWGIALQVHDLITAINDEIGTPITEIRVDGGGANNKLLMQFQSAIFENEILVASSKESTAWGTASLAGLTVGVWKNKNELFSQSANFYPQEADQHIKVESKKMTKMWAKAIPRAKNWIE